MDRKTDWAALAARIKQWGRELGFADVGIAPATSSDVAERGLLAWLEAGWHGEMDYMARHGLKRARPAELVPGALTVILARLPYWPDAADAQANLADGERAYISRYALGRDYHKLLRNRLQKLAERIEAEIGPYIHRAFSDSAPLLEGDFASRAGLGWRGKHTLLLTRDAGSAFFLGELVVALPLPPDPPQSAHCGSCTACLTHCPTAAIVAPWRIDARRCISYLTIELKGSIPLDLRPLIGNRIYGCDDCQLCCPWHRNTGPKLTREEDFAVRHGLDRARLVDLFAWSESEFQEKMAGSPIYRIGHERWLRNIAVALGNAPTTPAVLAALAQSRDDPSELVREHVAWALARHHHREVLAVAR
ncbi:putative Fe-S electron transport protein [Sterolibacterium denitrificans]|uniref:Epoxyqueuosine reductase n=2 Tax=Sterolibacterium denitrificans TaxID=157592 RepID=A0A656Z867_9PROT|nr:tRNA epoxyqueuosine(34) reductase QueG [Sterolibacterium denitrificans]KYC29220.1 epoxyqueuosine reductase [Sterolibacterium denitrificans]SMB29757.1 putative Fe-S electron transport protein [Sterolibacterium denitrificans]